MPRLPDLVRDTCLDTHFKNGLTIHSYNITDAEAYRRSRIEKVSWKRERKIGEGGFGAVYLERQTGKVLESQPSVRAVKAIRQTTHRDYVHELEAIAKFSHSRYERCFVKSFGWYERDDCLYIAMEYFNLGDLHQCISQLPQTSEHDALNITTQILEGIFFMHDNDFAHRDMKPQNVLVRLRPPDHPWWIKIADFGISKRLEDDKTTNSSVKGSLKFMAPELLLSSQNVFPRRLRDQYAADMWAVGCISYYLFTKDVPFKDIGKLLDYSRNATTCPVWSLSDIDISQLAQDFIARLLQADPKERPTVEAARSHQWLGKLIVDEPFADDMMTSTSETETNLDLEETTGAFESMHLSVMNAHPGYYESLRNSIPSPPSGRWTTQLENLEVPKAREESVRPPDTASWIRLAEQVKMKSNRSHCTARTVDASEQLNQTGGGLSTLISTHSSPRLHLEPDTKVAHAENGSQHYQMARVMRRQSPNARITVENTPNMYDVSVDVVPLQDITNDAPGKPNGQKRSRKRRSKLVPMPEIVQERQTDESHFASSKEAAKRTVRLTDLLGSILMPNTFAAASEAARTKPKVSLENFPYDMVSKYGSLSNTAYYLKAVLNKAEIGWRHSGSCFRCIYPDSSIVIPNKTTIFEITLSEHGLWGSTFICFRKVFGDWEDYKSTVWQIKKGWRHRTSDFIFTEY